MKVYLAYKVTMHGQPVYPEFIFRVKHRLERYLAEDPPFKSEEMVIKCVDLDLPKFATSHKNIEEAELVKGNLKELDVTFRSKDGVLSRFHGKKALDLLKKLK